MQALNDTIVLEIPEETKSSSGLVVVKHNKEEVEWGTVVLTGPGMQTNSGELIPLDVKVGDKVMIKSYAGTPFKHNGKDLRVITERDVLVYEANETISGQE